jgi:hypothetical protein
MRQDKCNSQVPITLPIMFFSDAFFVSLFLNEFRGLIDMSFKWLQGNVNRSFPRENIKMIFVELRCWMFLFYTHINTVWLTVWRICPNPHHSAALSKSVLTGVKGTPPSPATLRFMIRSYEALGSKLLQSQSLWHLLSDKRTGSTFAQCLGLRQVHVLKQAHCDRTKQMKRNSQRMNTCNINRASVRVGFVN